MRDHEHRPTALLPAMTATTSTITTLIITKEPARVSFEIMASKDDAFFEK